jgi:predicted nucleic acid-binding protein
MNGKVLLDTNAIIYALNDNLILTDAYYCISVITEIELYSYPKLSKDERQTIANLLKHFEVINLDEEIKEKTISIRKHYGIKLPDSIICASAIVNNATLISNDKQLSKVLELDIITLEKLTSR